MFGRIKDMRNMWERKRRIEGSRTLFKGLWGGIFGVFLSCFFAFWKRRRIIYNLP